MFKVSNKNIRRCSGVFTVNFEHMSHLVLVFLLLTLNMYFAGWMIDNLSSGNLEDCHRYLRHASNSILRKTILKY